MAIIQSSCSHYPRLLINVEVQIGLLLPCVISIPLIGFLRIKSNLTLTIHECMFQGELSPEQVAMMRALGVEVELVDQCPGSGWEW